MLGVFAEFETNLRRERQMEGIAAAKLRGVYKGRPASIDAAKVAALKAEGLGATEIAKRLGVGRASVYRVLASPTAPIAPEATPDALTLALRANPRVRIVPPSGKGFILPAKG
jgi:DNA invertase Pin-like site-specific DNA recombinase